MQTVTVVIISVAVVVLIFGCVFIIGKPNFPMTLRIQNDSDFKVYSDLWIPTPPTAFIAPGDGVVYKNQSFYIDKKYTGALFTINIQASAPVMVKFTGYGGSGYFEQVLAVIDKVGSTLWQAQTVNDYYRIELSSLDESAVVKLCRIGVQVNR